jgi:peptidoglycan glycosyltransferase
VNGPIRRLYVLFLVLFGVLIYFTSKNAVFDAKALRDNPLNRRALLEEQRIHRGTIRAADGTIVARSIKQRGGVYTRRYPTNGLFAHAIGYSFTTLGRAGLERYRNDELTGKNNELTSVLDQLRGKRQVGDNVRTTLDPAAQKVAYAELAGRKGAVVALDPRNGDVKVMASVPTYDPNLLRSPKTYSRLANDNANKPLVNRATQFGYAPGSTFKVVTATAAIDSGEFTPDSTVDGKNGVSISGVPLQNDFNQSFGPITLAVALEKSVNTVYAQVGEKLGKRTMREYMNRFGFNRKPQLDYPADQMSASGEYYNGHLISTLSPRVDVGRMAIGQDKLAVVPLQMAQVAAAVANGGRLMKPHMTDRIVDTDGRTVDTIKPEVQSTVMKPSTASAVTAMMERVVQSGTGTQAQIPGIRVAGKTGTAETQIGTKINNVWFIAFAPADHPTVAIAVTMQGQPGFGGDVAAPVAKAVMESLLK